MRPLEVRRTSETRASPLRCTQIVFGGARAARTSSRPRRRAPRQRGKCQVERVSRQAPKKYLSAGARDLPVCVRSQRTANASYLHQSESDGTRAREYGFSTPRARRSELRVTTFQNRGGRVLLFPHFRAFRGSMRNLIGPVQRANVTGRHPAFSRDSNSRTTVCGAKRRLIFFTCEKISALGTLRTRSWRRRVPSAVGSQAWRPVSRIAKQRERDGWPGRMREPAGVKRIALAPSTNYERQLLEDAFDR